MPESVRVPDSDYAAVISIHNMVFSNVFSNIRSTNNTLKILSTWLDGSNVTQSNLITITIPIGNYGVDQLFAYINTYCSTLSTYYYGLGTNGDTTLPGFALSTSDITKCQIAPPSLTVLNNTYNSGHVYSGFYLILDNDTRGLLEDLGLLTYAQGLDNTSAIPNTTYFGIGFSCYRAASTYVLSATFLKSGDALSLGGIKALSIQWSAVTGGVRSSYANLAKDATIGIVPIDQDTGNQVNYDPANPYKFAVPGLNVSAFTFIIRDSATGELVNFNGADWILTVLIEIREINNEVQGQAKDGNYGQQYPIFHGSHPISGVGQQFTYQNPNNPPEHLKRSRNQ